MGKELKVILLEDFQAQSQQSAGKAGKSPQEFVDGICTQFSDLWKTLKVEPDDFLRTTQARHKKLVGEVLEKLHRQGDIVKGTFKGFYSVRIVTGKQIGRAHV